MYRKPSKPQAQFILTGAIAILVQIIAASIFYNWAKQHNLLGWSPSLLTAIAVGSIVFVLVQLVVVAYFTKKFLSYIVLVEEQNALYASDKFGDSQSMRSQLRRVFGFVQLLYRKNNKQLNREGRDFLRYIYMSAKVMTKGMKPKTVWSRAPIKGATFRIMPAYLVPLWRAPMAIHILARIRK